MLPTLEYEIDLWKQGYTVVGVDEVGRGALAGPVYVGAYSLVPAYNRNELKDYLSLTVKDCKQLSPLQREKMFTPLGKIALAWTVEMSDVAYINRCGIVAAVQRAIRTAVDTIRKKLNKETKLFVMLDAFRVPDLPGIDDTAQKAIIKGDEKIYSIAAASVLAKVLRDRYMCKLAEKEPSYSFEKNKGYGTKLHLESLRRCGKSLHHRDLYVRKVFGLRLNRAL